MMVLINVTVAIGLVVAALEICVMLQSLIGYIAQKRFEKEVEKEYKKHLTNN